MYVIVLIANFLKLIIYLHVGLPESVQFVTVHTVIYPLYVSGNSSCILISFNIAKREI